MPDTPARVAFLKKTHLFRGLNDGQLASVAEAMQEETYGGTETIFIEGTITDTFYLIFAGSVDIFSLKNKKEVKIASLFKGDYFGEQSLWTNRTHNATVRAQAGTVLLKLYRDKFRALLTKIPDLRPNFATMINSRQLARQVRFSWLNTNEVIYFLSRRHEFRLYQALTGPVLVGLFSLLVLGLVFAFPSVALAGAGGFFLVLALLWGLWQYVDWSNDYYVVTNQRVVSIEKMIGAYDSRDEALMNTILSVNTETDQMGRIFKYGTVVVRTFTGEIRMVYSPRPKQAANMIEEYWLRTKDVSRQNDEEIIKNSIRKKLGLPTKALAAILPPPATSTSSASVPPKSLNDSLAKTVKEKLNFRKEAGETIIYHKHWIVLVRHVVLPTLSVIGLIAFYPLWFVFSVNIMPIWLASIVALAILACVGWWAYGYMDWENDVYQVTPDQIVDIYRVPFGDEDRKSAPLENILSSQYKRSGIFGLLFNYGTVFIQVGGTNFDFVDVVDPPTVQQDIIRRKLVRDQKKREADTAAERERMADWLAMYHRTVTEFQKEAEQNKKQN
jgi:CRP-like cAMP-binding protein